VWEILFDSNAVEERTRFQSGAYALTEKFWSRRNILPSKMPTLKRKRGNENSRPRGDASDSESSIDEIPMSDGEIDISSTLVGRHGLMTDGEDDEDFIRLSMAKQNIKSGTELLKKTKGKKISKGELGGGSFQSMGMSPFL